ncbi:MAG: ATP-binding cassette domain-containing protein [Planctomycetaceae bacterium]
MFDIVGQAPDWLASEVPWWRARQSLGGASGEFGILVSGGGMAGDDLLQGVDLVRRTGDGGRVLLDRVCLTVRGGDRVALVGESGSGKSLLLRALSRLDGVDEGVVLWREQPIEAAFVPSFRCRAMYFPQRAVLLEGTVEENLRRPFALQEHRLSEYDPERVLKLLGRCHRGETFLKQSSRELSGGEAQIVALVRGLQLQPDLLLLDEPTAALDAKTTHDIESLLIDWHAEAPQARAWVWVTHDSAQTRRVGNRILTMKHGQLVETSGADDPA